ncbi:MAG: phosphate signaling complex protein PhoU [Actinomycetota bacterium]|nr:phosphate signaling complex protein PhoU [Actinomycetota bacterium]
MGARPARQHYHSRLFLLEDRLLLMGHSVVDMAGEAVAALTAGDVQRAAAVVRSDDRLDDEHQELQEEILTLLALQAPVARELRLVSACLHVSGHLERMGDLCVNIARSVEETPQPNGDEPVLAQLDEMGRHARRLIRQSLDAFARRDASTAGRLRALDDPIDRLNRQLFRRLVELVPATPSRLDWAMRMVLVARYLERLGDHAVDIGTQAAFVATGRPVRDLTAGPG